MVRLMHPINTIGFLIPYARACRQLNWVLLGKISLRAFRGLGKGPNYWTDLAHRPLEIGEL